MMMNKFIEYVLAGMDSAAADTGVQDVYGF